MGKNISQGYATESTCTGEQKINIYRKKISVMF